MEGEGGACRYSAPFVHQVLYKWSCIDPSQRLIDVTVPVFHSEDKCWSVYTWGRIGFLSPVVWLQILCPGCMKGARTFCDQSQCVYIYMDQLQHHLYIFLNLLATPYSPHHRTRRQAFCFWHVGDETIFFEHQPHPRQRTTGAFRKYLGKVAVSLPILEDSSLPPLPLCRVTFWSLY